MARKQITSVRLGQDAPRSGWQPMHLERVRWLEDGKTFPQDEPQDKVARAINSGEAFYVRRPDGVEVAVLAKLRHGKYFLTSQPDASQPDNLLGLPTY